MQLREMAATRLMVFENTRARALIGSNLPQRNSCRALDFGRLCSGSASLARECAARADQNRDFLQDVADQGAYFFSLAGAAVNLSVARHRKDGET